MADGKATQCKTKGCNNPVLDGKYCMYCTQARKEKKKNFLSVAGASVIGISVIVNAIKNVDVKKLQKFAKDIVMNINKG
ncbi:MAG: hypothetical protein GYA36_16210 [Veillonellaceae bacterium]|nr:hypothetical protein [Veillonellaceae bacterium]